MFDDLNHANAGIIIEYPWLFEGLSIYLKLYKIYMHYYSINFFIEYTFHKTRLFVIYKSNLTLSSLKIVKFKLKSK